MHRAIAGCPNSSVVLWTGTEMKLRLKAGTGWECCLYMYVQAEQCLVSRLFFPPKEGISPCYRFCHRVFFSWWRCLFVVKSWAGGRYKEGEDIYQTTNKLVCIYKESTIGP